jgi:hypothetical protein
MFTFKNLAALAMFLFGTTFVWMTAAFSGQSPTPSGGAWTVEGILALGAVAGFTVASWGMFKGDPWWETMALVSAIVGLVAVIPYGVNVNQMDGGFADPGVQINLAMHLVGSVIILWLVLVPSAEHWFTAHLH